MRVALAYNLIQEHMIRDCPLDSIAEYDSIETINALKSAIEYADHEVTLMEADLDFVQKMRELSSEIDIVFNIAEGIRGQSRESFVPVICEALDIPYTGSGPLALAICLSKSRAKDLFRYYKIPTPNSNVAYSMNDISKIDLDFPVIIKLNEEGSSKGLDYDSVVHDYDQLRSKMAFLLDKYGSSVIIEDFIEGREFTVPIMTNNPPVVLPIIEVVYQDLPKGLPNINLFEPDDYDSVSILIEKYNKKNEIKRSNHTSICPANLDEKLQHELESLALKAYRSLDVKDWCRMEFRVDKHGQPFLLELNPIPGIDPEYFFPKSARSYGLNYNQLIDAILDSAIRRYHLK